MDITYKGAFIDDTDCSSNNAVCKGCCRGSIMPTNTLEARWEEEDVERSLRSFVLGEL